MHNAFCPSVPIYPSLARYPAQHILHPQASSHLLLRSPTLRPSTSHPLGLRPLQVLCRNPALVIRFGAARDSGAVSAHNSSLIGRIDLLRLAG